MSQPHVKTADELPMTSHQRAQLHHFVQTLHVGDVFVCAGETDPMRQPRIQDLQKQVELASDLRRKLQNALAEVRSFPLPDQQHQARDIMETLKEEMLQLVALSDAYEASSCLPDYNHYVRSYHKHCEQIRMAREAITSDLDSQDEDEDT